MHEYTPLKVETTITTPDGVSFKELEARCLLPMKADSGYEVSYNIKKVSYSPDRKHFDILLTIGSPLYQVSELEIEILVHRYCNYFNK